MRDVSRQRCPNGYHGADHSSASHGQLHQLSSVAQGEHGLRDLSFMAAGLLSDSPLLTFVMRKQRILYRELGAEIGQLFGKLFDQLRWRQPAVVAEYLR